MGEFNVNKSDGSLEQTAGMPDTYPATQVMMSDGVTSVEDAVSGYHVVKTVTADGSKTYKTLINELFDGVTIASCPDIKVNILGSIFAVETVTSNVLQFVSVSAGSSDFTLFSIIYHRASGHASTSFRDIVLANNGSYHDRSSEVLASGNTISLLTR